MVDPIVLGAFPFYHYLALICFSLVGLHAIVGRDMMATRAVLGLEIVHQIEDHCIAMADPGVRRRNPDRIARHFKLTGIRFAMPCQEILQEARRLY